MGSTIPTFEFLHVLGSETARDALSLDWLLIRSGSDKKTNQPKTHLCSPGGRNRGSTASQASTLYLVDNPPPHELKQSPVQVCPALQRYSPPPEMQTGGGQKYNFSLMASAAVRLRPCPNPTQKELWGGGGEGVLQRAEQPLAGACSISTPEIPNASCKHQNMALRVNEKNNSIARPSV